MVHGKKNDRHHGGAEKKKSRGDFMELGKEKEGDDLSTANK